MEIKSVSIIGAGQMGSGIAQVFAGADYEVRLYDISKEAIDKGLANITKTLDRAIGKSLITEDDKNRTLKKHQPRQQLAGLRRCGFGDRSGDRTRND